MWRLHPMFWILALFFFLFWSRRRRWSRRWAMGGSAGYPPSSPHDWDSRRSMYRGSWTETPQPIAPHPLAEHDAALVESLESRIAGLEQRLDFAERLLADRGQPPRGPGV